jgi:hypothetical protein
MDILMVVVGVIVGAGLLAVIAFPERFTPDRPVKTKKVGASYWGRYEGDPTEESEEEKTLTVKLVKSKERVIGGSTTYAAGRGISFRGGSG